MSAGFFPAPGADYSYGSEPTLAQRLTALAKGEGLHLTGLSGHRTPAHSLAVGGTANDPHTKGLASDTPGAENVPESTLEKYGLTRPMTAWHGRDERDHIQLLPGFKGGGDGGSIGDQVLHTLEGTPVIGPAVAGADALVGGSNPITAAAGGLAGDVAGAIAKLLANTLGKEGAKILLYIAFVVGGAVLVGAGTNRLFNGKPAAAARKAGTRAAVAAA